MKRCKIPAMQRATFPKRQGRNRSRQCARDGVAHWISGYGSLIRFDMRGRECYHFGLAAADPSPAPAPEPVVAENVLGKSVFNKTCALCHAAGVAGAPKPGDTADWGPRIAQGNDLLYKHAMEGFTGAKGMMPARGGNAALTDDEVKAAVDYMVGRSK